MYSDDDEVNRGQGTGGGTELASRNSTHLGSTPGLRIPNTGGPLAQGRGLSPSHGYIIGLVDIGSVTTDMAVASPLFISNVMNSDNDIGLVMNHASATRDQAIAALDSAGGDVVSAIMELS